MSCPSFEAFKEAKSTERDKFLMYLFTSTISNTVGTFCGHPLDTIRVRLQMEAKGVTPLKVIKDTYRGEGIGGFFKGVISPLIGSTPYNVSCFTITSIVKDKLG